MSTADLKLVRYFASEKRLGSVLYQQPEMKAAIRRVSDALLLSALATNWDIE